MAYDLKSVKAPRLAGAVLRIFAWLLEHAPTRALIMPKLLKDAGLNEFRADCPETAPTNLPFVLPEPAKGTGAKPAAPLPTAKQSSILQKSAAKATKSKQAAPASEAIWPGVRDYRAAYAKKQITPVKVAEQVISAIESSNAGERPLRAIIASDSDEVRALAKASAARWKKGKPLGPFDGVPVAVKDELDQAGYPTSVGTAFLGRQPVRQDATSVRRLREQGALLIGKANMHEIGIAVTGNNPHHGIARNPYDLNRYTGGSSSGSGGAVAAGLCPMAIGADGGGSVRIPAAFCGVVGLKATYGRISEYGAAPLCWSVAHVGPLGASVDDVLAGYLSMAGPDPLDPITLKQPAMDPAEFAGLHSGVRGLAFGVYEPWLQHAAPEIVAACEAQIRRFEKAGARVRKVEIPGLNALRVAHVISIASEMAMSMEEHYRKHRKDFGCDVRINLALARTFSSRDYVRAQRVRTRAMADFARVLHDTDVLLTPATGIVAPEILADALSAGESDLEKLTETMRFVVAANMTGNPAIAFPVGYDQAGLPIAMQAIGSHWQEATLLRVAAAAERNLQRRSPELIFDLLGMSS